MPFRGGDWAEAYAGFLANPGRTDWLVPWARATRCLPLYVDWTHVLGLTADGQIVSSRHDPSPVGEPVNQPVTDPLLRNVAVHQGARVHPWVLALAPPRPADARTCPHCEGTGRLRDPLVCACGGAGWLAARTSPRLTLRIISETQSAEDITRALDLEPTRVTQTASGKVVWSLAIDEPSATGLEDGLAKAIDRLAPRAPALQRLAITTRAFLVLGNGGTDLTDLAFACDAARIQTLAALGVVLDVDLDVEAAHRARDEVEGAEVGERVWITAADSPSRADEAVVYRKERVREGWAYCLHHPSSAVYRNLVCAIGDTRITRTGRTVDRSYFHGTRREMSVDLVPAPDRRFVDGCYRLPGCDWEVFTVSTDAAGSATEVEWPVGSDKTVHLRIRLAPTVPLDPATVHQALCTALGVESLTEVRGPDSMALRTR